MSEGIKITSEHSSHEDFRELYSYGTKEELIKYHSIAVDYNVALHKVKLKLEQQLKEANEVIETGREKLKEINNQTFTSTYRALMIVNLLFSFREYLNKFKVKDTHGEVDKI